MHIQTPLTALTLLSAAAGQPHPRRRCTSDDACWPTAQTWTEFNATVGGRLIRSVPSAAVCHGSRYNADQCATAKSNWFDGAWRSNQTGGYAATVWEMGETGECFINTPIQAECDQGIVPYYSVRAESVEDIQASVRFASEKDLYLVTKNTGHDHLGRSSGKGAFSIWTHNMKGIEWHDSFVPLGAPDTDSIPAVTLQAGEQWSDVYEAASEKGVIVVGGSARSVGAAGGYLLGGGHSPFAHYHGLAADNLLEMSIVSADGEHLVLNRYTDPEYFWAVRGGGGSSWGVVTSVTYKTHPVPENLIMGFVKLNASSNASLTNLVAESLKLLPDVTDAGYIGYADLSGGFGGFFMKPNSTVAAFNETFAGFFNLSTLPGVKGMVGAYPSDWNGYRQTILTDPHIGTNVQDTSRLLTADVLQEKADDLARFLVKNGGGGFNFIGKVNDDERDNTAVHDIWKKSHALLSISVDWADNATQAEKHKKRLHAVHLSEGFSKIVGSDDGTYINEANPYEPNWERVFWGDKYERLLDIKRRVDPTSLFICNRCIGGELVLQA
ncbi:hypothetical protein ASPVEDRAFT_47727 [Aspergillus versicolor CBS 583.65]|uniref:FAD-binding PCMH-type domain-containing protein n=1 Tax=Aspergillus versicolor CBS 583.65 TaxID=1036611 RepID=A0A1L9Q492_ASPVE|nr:uncharacterized protein ASPVEDRAFT_47727 [Aspergillus versicolor CBS 583.65]OJJ08593.1 hypothetical protein ASPVEDRAFT_47727 [Aspergillus versicolor CBS 583.65]